MRDEVDHGTPCGEEHQDDGRSCPDCLAILHRLADALRNRAPRAFECRWECGRQRLPNSVSGECEACQVAARRKGRDRSGRPIRASVA